MALIDYTEKELQDEMKRRKGKKRPQQIVQPNWSNVIATVEASLDEMEKKDSYFDEDNEHYVWEEVCKALYGDKFFDWFNKTSL